MTMHLMYLLVVQDIHATIQRRYVVLQMEVHHPAVVMKPVVRWGVMSTNVERLLVVPRGDAVLQGHVVV